MSNFDDFFNAKPIVAEATPTQISEFRPNPKKGQNGVFNAVVRFLPNPEDPVNKSIISKYVVYLDNPATQTKMTVDCPSTVGAFDPIQNTFFALRSSNNPVLQENAKKFSRKQQFVSLVQILDCKSDPSLVNKILVWKYGTKINEKLTAEMNPPMGEGHNPFNLLSGRPFNVQVKEVAGYPNYDACQFFDLDIAQSGMRVINPATGVPAVVTVDTISTPQGKEMVFNYLKTNAPATTQYEYHEMDQKQVEFVNQCIQLYSNPQATVQAMSAVMNPGAATVQQQPMAAQAAAAPSFSMPQPAAPMAAPAAPSMPTMGLGANQAAPVSPGGFQALQLSADVDALLNQAAPAEKKATPTMGMDLADVLGGQML